MHHLTAEGLEKFKSEYATLQNERPAAVDNLKKARELGDLSENGYYKASRARLSFIDSRLIRLKRILKTVSIISRTTNEHISLGNIVTVQTENAEKIYQVVGKLEAHPTEGKISDESPLGRALLGKHIGDTVAVHAPKGRIAYRIVRIES